MSCTKANHGTRGSGATLRKPVSETDDRRRPRYKIQDSLYSHPPRSIEILKNISRDVSTLDVRRDRATVLVGDEGGMNCNFFPLPFLAADSKVCETFGLHF